MKTNTKLFLSLVIVSIIYAMFFILQPEPGEGFSDIAQGLGFIFGIVAVSIIFGIFGFILNSSGTSFGKKFIHSISWFGISFVILMIFFITAAKWKQKEWQKTYPQTAPSVSLLINN